MGGRGASSASRAVTVYDKALKESRGYAEMLIERMGSGGIAEQIPQWIIDKDTRLGIRTSEMYVVRETERALLVSDEARMFGASQDGEFWVPKSQLQSAAKTKQEIYDKAANSFVSDMYTSYLKKTAAENNVKIGNLGSSWGKITAKLQKKGLTVMSREEFKKSKA